MLTAYGAEIVVTPTAVAPDTPSPTTASPTGSPVRSRARSSPTSTPTRTARSATTRPPAPRSGATPTARSPTSSPASAPAAPSPAPAATCARCRDDTVRIIGADPEGSVYSGGTGRPYLVEGVGEDFWPDAYDPTVVARDHRGLRRRVVRDDPPPRPRGGHPRRRLQRHGRRRRPPRRGSRSAADDVVVVLLPDGGRGYLGKIFNDELDAQLRLHATRRPGTPSATCSPPRPPHRPRSSTCTRATPCTTPSSAMTADGRLAAARAHRRAARRDGRGRRRARRDAGCSTSCSPARRSSPTRSATVVGEVAAADRGERARRRRAGRVRQTRRAARHRRRQAARRHHPPRPAHLPAALYDRARRERTMASEAQLRHPRHPRRAGVRPDDRRGHPADLPDLDLRAGRHRRPARRLRVLARRQPHPHRAARRSSPRSRAASTALSFASGLAAEDALLRAVLAPGDHIVHRQRRVRRHAPPDRAGATAPWGVRQHDRRHDRPATRCERRSCPARPRCSGSRRPATR